MNMSKSEFYGWLRTLAITALLLWMWHLVGKH